MRSSSVSKHIVALVPNLIESPFRVGNGPATPLLKNGPKSIKSHLVPVRGFLGFFSPEFVETIVGLTVEVCWGRPELQKSRAETVRNMATRRMSVIVKCG